MIWIFQEIYVLLLSKLSQDKICMPQNINFITVTMFYRIIIMKLKTLVFPYFLSLDSIGKENLSYKTTW